MLPVASSDGLPGRRRCPRRAGRRSYDPAYASASLTESLGANTFSRELTCLWVILAPSRALAPVTSFARGIQILVALGNQSIAEFRPSDFASQKRPIRSGAPFSPLRRLGGGDPPNGANRVLLILAGLPATHTLSTKHPPANNHDGFSEKDHGEKSCEVDRQDGLLLRQDQDRRQREDQSAC